ncbi:bifunctional pyr operon transcriptional regulator/uracil phosphoribosyltransferase, partial [Burkholderia multivorans]
MTERTVLDGGDVRRATTRIAHEIIESNKGTDDLVLLGIPRRVVPLANRLGGLIADISG